LPGVVVMVSSAVSSRALAGSLGSLSAETTHGAETHRSECQDTFRDTGRAHEQQPVGVLVDLGHHTMHMLELEDRVPTPAPPRWWGRRCCHRSRASQPCRCGLGAIECI
jgi:hypothetical protein